VLVTAADRRKQKQQSDKRERVSPRKSGKEATTTTTTAAAEVGGGRLSNGATCPLFFYRGAPLFFCNFAPVHATRSVSLFCCGFFAVAAFIHKNQVVKKEQQRKNDSDFIYLCQFADALPLQFVFIVLH